MMALSKCVLDRVSERKNELKSRMYGLVEIMSRSVFARMQKRTSLYKDLLDQLVEQVFEIFKQELDAAWKDGCAYECDCESSLHINFDEEFDLDSEIEDDSLSISSLESQASSSSSQQSHHKCIYRVKFYAEDGEEYYEEISEDRVEVIEVVDNDAIEEHFREAQTLGNDSSLSKNGQIEADMSEDDQQFEIDEKLVVDGLSGMTNSVSIELMDNDDDHVEVNEVYHWSQVIDLDNGQMDEDDENVRNDEELAVDGQVGDDENSEHGDGELIELVNYQLNVDDETVVDDLDDPSSSDSIVPPEDVTHQMESIETNADELSNLNSFGSMHSQPQQSTQVNYNEEYETTLQSNEDSSLHSSPTQSQPSSQSQYQIVNDDDDVTELKDMNEDVELNEVIERPNKRKKSEQMEGGKNDVMDNEDDHVEGNEVHHGPQRIDLDLAQNVPNGKVVPNKSQGKHICEYCGKGFTRRYSLTVHSRTHTGDQAFRCTWAHCGKAFGRIQHLESHECKHTGNKPHKCPWEGCNKAFIQRWHMQYHLKVHTEFPFVCENCLKRFKIQSELNDHTLKCIKMRPYKCTWDKCNRTFAQQCYMKLHLQSHQGLLPHVCQQCGKNFAKPCYLKRHIRTHTGEKPYKCEWNDCGKTYKQKCHLKTHFKTHTTTPK